jgi:hypothetical protein
MFQINPDLCKINSDLQEIHFQLGNPQVSNLLEIEEQISLVSDFIEYHLQTPTLPYHERDLLLTQKDELTSLAGKCNDQARKMQFAQIFNPNARASEQELMKAFKQTYNLTLTEQEQIESFELLGDKIVPLYPLSAESIIEFSELSDLCYEMAVAIHQKDLRRFAIKWAQISEEDQISLRGHIEACEGSIEDEAMFLGTIRALIGYAEQYPRGAITYPSHKEALEVVIDLSEIYS